MTQLQLMSPKQIMPSWATEKDSFTMALLIKSNVSAGWFPPPRQWRDGTAVDCIKAFYSAQV